MVSGERIVLRGANATAQTRLARFAQHKESEGRAIAKLRCRNVIRVFDVDVTAAGLPFPVVEFLEGHDLSVELARKGRIDSRTAVRFILDACTGLAEAHRHA